MANISAGGRIDGPLGFTGFGTGLAGGDFNGDGVSDLAITYQFDGGSRANSAAVVQIIYGGDDVFDGEVASVGLLGGSVTTTGETDIGVGIDVPGPLEFADINGDGGADLLIGAPRALSSAAETGGAAFALFGAEGTDPFAFTFPNLVDGATGSGFTATGGQNTGSVFTNLGDIDNDGEDEFFIGAPFTPSPGGDSLSGLGFVFAPNGDAATDFAAAPTGLETTLFGDTLTFLAEDAAGVGDVNGDGIDDFVVSGRGAAGAGTRPLTLNSGEAYLVFGADGGLGATLDVSTLDGTAGVKIIGSDTFTVNGQIESAGDVNGDGLDDFLLQDDGANTAAPLFYLVYGTDDDFGATFDISTAPADRVSTFGGVSASSASSGVDMAGVGDVNGDGFDDLAIGASTFNPPGNSEYTFGAPGAVFVIYGGLMH